MSALVWRDGCGYRCPRCKLFVAIPQRDVPQYCPRCPAVESVEVTAGDRPDNGQDELDAVVQTIADMYRDPEVARYAMNDLRDWLSGDREAPSTAVRAALRAANLPLASARAGAWEQQREQVARWLFAHDGSTPSAWDRLLNDAGKRVWLRYADELLALLDRTQPDGDVRQHRTDPDCWCGPVNVGPDAWEHQDGEVEW